MTQNKPPPVVDARSRFPLGATGYNKAFEVNRWKCEAALKREVIAFRAKLYRSCGMAEHPSMLKAGIMYAPMVKGFDALWRILEQAGGWGAEVLDECAGNADVRAALKLLNLGPVSLESLSAAVKSNEFEAYRNDVTYLRCLAAERKAFEMLPKIMGAQMARDHSYEQVRKKSAAFRDETEQRMVELQEDGDVDGDDISAMLDTFKDQGDDP